jgi:Bacterial Ig-like domain (group 3)
MHPTVISSISMPLRAALISVLLAASTSLGQITSATDVNLSQKSGDDSECAIAVNPTNKLQVFALCNTSGSGLMAKRSTDGGQTWTYPDPADKTIADGDAGQGPAACCDPTLAWDTFGNLFITYIGSGLNTIETILSTDGGVTFTNLASFSGAVDQPTVVAANTTDPGAPVAVWIVWNQNNAMVARGAKVTGLGTANISAFNPLQNIPGTSGCNFGDVAVAPDGAVVQVCESPSTGQGPASLLVNTDADGFGSGNFGAAVTATSTNVGGFDFIPAQNARSIDSEAGLAFDSNPSSPHFRRLYLVYTEETVNENNDTDIMLRFSDDNGATWSSPQRVNDDPAIPIRSQFLPKIAVNSDSGNVAICWYDARNSATNTAAQMFCTTFLRTDPTPVFQPNALVSDGTSTSNGAGIEFGDYTGLSYFRGFFHPIWADTSNSTGDNPNATANFDAYTDRVQWNPLANEGDPHITTADGIHYDFQGAGEFTVLRDVDGFEIQTRQTAIATTFFPGANPYTGLATCVSLNSAVAARVGKHRVTYEPNLSGVPDPSGLQLRVDGALKTLSPAGLNLPSGGRVSKAPAGDGIEIDFPNGAILIATSNYWASQGKWYLNVDVFHSGATDGIMGAIARGSWLPALPDGSNLGPRPAALNQRFADLYHRFADAWRVTDKTSLFDYRPGTSTATFTLKDWPKESAPCVVPENTPAKPLDPNTAEKLCSEITTQERRMDCVFDVTATGEVGFAKTYLTTQKILRGSTRTILRDLKEPTLPQEPATFVAKVVPNVTAVGREAKAGNVPTGTVQFFVDGAKAGTPVNLDGKGSATFKTVSLKPERHSVTATYIPSRGSTFFPSSSLELFHFVGGRN